MRYLTLAFALAAFGCSTNSRILDDPKALLNLKSQAAEVGRAMVEEDHARMADLTNPVLIEHFGNRDAYIKKIMEIANDMRQRGIKIHSVEFGRPSTLREFGGIVYAIYPYLLKLKEPHEKIIQKHTYLICTSSNGGINWKFLDGEGVKGDRKKLKQVLPRFPEDLPLPEWQAVETSR